MKISVAFIVYNGANYMRTQLDSILAQKYKVDEIIVVEDASTDNTKEILKSYTIEFPGLFYIKYNNDKNKPKNRTTTEPQNRMPDSSLSGNKKAHRLVKRNRRQPWSLVC